jgi:hypothetical protein
MAIGRFWLSVTSARERVRVLGRAFVFAWARRFGGFTFACREAVATGVVNGAVDPVMLAEATGVEAVSETDVETLAVDTVGVDRVTLGADTGALGVVTVTPPIRSSAAAAVGMTVAASRPQIAARINRPTPNGLKCFIGLSLSPADVSRMERALPRLQRRIRFSGYGFRYPNP